MFKALSFLSSPQEFIEVALLKHYSDYPAVISRKLFWTALEAHNYKERILEQMPGKASGYIVSVQRRFFKNIAESERLDSLDELYL